MMKLEGKEKFQYKNFNYSKCNGTGNTDIVNLPPDFFVRLEYGDKALGYFERFKFPTFKDYFMTSTIQYHPRTRHFRLLKCFGRDRTDVYDGNSVSKLYSNKDRKLLEEDSEWKNYVVHYQKIDKS